LEWDFGHKILCKKNEPTVFSVGFICINKWCIV
jgi:hypothetical protein